MADKPTNKADVTAIDEPTGEIDATASDEPANQTDETTVDEPALDAAEESTVEDVEAASEVDLQTALENAQAEAEGLKDTALRAQAEVENVRRRATRDVENAHKFALERFAGELLPVIDSLEKAVESAATTDAATAVTEGVDLSLKLFLATLGKHGIEQIDPLGEPFNPEHHEAIAMVENPDAEPNSVMEVMQKGYLLNGRLIRAAKVIVAKAPSDDGPEDDIEEADDTK
ncbi:MAG: nucleotide exchange factor GrpE [Pseudomonadales bacterium]